MRAAFAFMGASTRTDKKVAGVAWEDDTPCPAASLTLPDEGATAKLLLGRDRDWLYRRGLRRAGHVHHAAGGDCEGRGAYPDGSCAIGRVCTMAPTRQLDEEALDDDCAAAW